MPSLRIVLIYPPPWKIGPANQDQFDASEGAPIQFRNQDIDPDFLQIPYGLLSLAAEAIQAGHTVKVFNLASWQWNHVDKLLASLDADIFGLSCFTANRRGVAFTADSIRKHHPNAYIVVGGPHASALPLDMLHHHESIDAVVVGEGEATFLDLCSQLANGNRPTAVPGTAYRSDRSPKLAEPRTRIKDLDALASPHKLFSTHLLLTSRGCPGRCTFCASSTVWGNAYRIQSVSRVLDDIRDALARVPVRLLQIKDDTFTSSRRRTIEICDGIRERKLNFIWSCDTRADSLSDDTLIAMRLAGCQRVSIGVESGSPTILRNIHKNISPERIRQTTEAAKRVGIQIRYYMMLGNRGETEETFRQSNEFVNQAKPHQALFACLSIYPGTPDFTMLESAGAITRDEYFKESFQELKVPFDASKKTTALMSAWFAQNAGILTIHKNTIEELKQVLELVGDHHAAHVDLGAAYFQGKSFDLAEHHLRRGLELNYPLKGIIYNYLACIAWAKGSVEGAQREFANAGIDPLHPSLLKNVNAFRTWLNAGGFASASPLTLSASHDFQIFEKLEQPILPGPVGPEFANWP